MTTRRHLFVVHWEEYDKLLPTSLDCASKLRQRKLFEEFDPKGEGIVQQPVVVRGLFRLVPRVGGINDTRSLIELCFRITQQTIRPVIDLSYESLDRNQFRVLLITLRCYLRLWEQFYNYTEGRSSDSLVRVSDIQAFQPVLEEWSPNVEMLLIRLQEDVKQLDTLKSGVVPFNKFADCCLRRTLSVLAEYGEEAEKEETRRLLKQTHSHLFHKDPAEAPPKKTAFGGVTMALGMRPRMSASKFAMSPVAAKGTAQVGFDGAVTRYVKQQNQGWSTQALTSYSIDYQQPKQRELTLALAAQSHTPHVRNVDTQYTRDYQPPDTRRLLNARSVEFQASYQNQSQPKLRTARSAPVLSEGGGLSRPSGLVVAGGLISLRQGTRVC